jgi:hypothetical protein
VGCGWICCCIDRMRSVAWDGERELDSQRAVRLYDLSILSGVSRDLTKNSLSHHSRYFKRFIPAWTSENCFMQYRSEDGESVDEYIALIF